MESPDIAKVYWLLPPEPRTVPPVTVKVSDDRATPFVVMIFEPPVTEIIGLTVMVS